MKIFIDLGAYNGDTIEEAMIAFSDCEKFYAFEPFECNFNELITKFKNDDRVIVIKKAASDKNGEERLFIKHGSNEGNSICSNKNNVSSDFVVIDCVDFSQFVLDNFDKTDEIILKVNIEGAEYSMFDKMINDDSICYIDKIFCEWHVHKIHNIKSGHDRIVSQLNKKGFNLTGSNDNDAFVIHVKRINNGNK